MTRQTTRVPCLRASFLGPTFCREDRLRSAKKNAAAEKQTRQTRLDTGDRRNRPGYRVLDPGGSGFRGTRPGGRARGQPDQPVRADDTDQSGRAGPEGPLPGVARRALRRSGVEDRRERRVVGFGRGCPTPPSRTGTFGPLGQALDRDKEAGTTYGAAFKARQDKLNETNKPYAADNSSGGRDYHAPEFGGDILAFTFGKQRDLYYKTFELAKPLPGKASLDKAKEVFEAFDTTGDDFGKAYKPFAGDELFGVGGKGTPGSANDIATFLRFGGFLKKAPEPDSPGIPGRGRAAEDRLGGL